MAKVVECYDLLVALLSLRRVPSLVVCNDSLLVYSFQPFVAFNTDVYLLLMIVADSLPA